MLSIETLTELESGLTKESLENGYFKWVKKFYSENAANLFKDTKDANLNKIAQLLANKKTFNKVEVLSITFSVFADGVIFYKFLSTLPQPIPEIIAWLTWRESITNEEIENKYSISVYNNEFDPKQRIDSWNVHLYIKSEFGIFKRESSKSWSFQANKEVYYHSFSIQPVIKKILQQYIPKPKTFQIVFEDTPPKADYTLSLENNVFDEIPQLLTYYLQGSIKYNANGKPSESTLGKMQKMCGIAELYPKEQEGVDKIRCYILAAILYGFKHEDLDSQNLDILKKIYTKFYLKVHTVSFLLTSLKGWGHLGNYDFNPECQNHIKSVLKEIGSDSIGKWIDINNFIELFSIRSLLILPISSTSISKLYYDERYKDFVDKNYLSHRRDADNFLKIPFVKATIFLYASLGMVEIAYNNIDTNIHGTTYFSNYDGLTHFRLTALGAFILGITDKYESLSPVDTNKLTLSTDSLIIVAQGNMSVVDVMLNPYSEKLGKTRYKVTAQTFLKECRNKKDIENKIARFKKTINSSIPTIWEQFLKQLVVNASSVLINTTVQTYTLPVENKDLHRIVAQDAVLKQLILKAEGFNLLVKNENLAKFKSRMKELGYLVE